MPRPRSQYARRRPAIRPQGAWYNDQSSPAQVAGGGTAIIDLFKTGAGFLPVIFQAGFKVNRLIAEVQMQPVLSATTVEGAFGIAIVSRDALDSAAIPDALTGFQDWYWHKNFWCRSRDDDMTREKIDLKTARNIRGSERTLAFILNIVIGSATLEFSFNQRSWLTVK